MQPKKDSSNNLKHEKHIKLCFTNQAILGRTCKLYLRRWDHCKIFPFSLFIMYKIIFNITL